MRLLENDSHAKKINKLITYLLYYIVYIYTHIHTRLHTLEYIYIYIFIGTEGKKCFHFFLVFFSDNFFSFAAAAN